MRPALFAILSLAVACCGSAPIPTPEPTPTCDAGQEQCGAGCITLGDVCCNTYFCPAGKLCAGENDAGQGLCQ